jgi:hypothetical protein
MSENIIKQMGKLLLVNQCNMPERWCQSRAQPSACSSLPAESVRSAGGASLYIGSKYNQRAEDVIQETIRRSIPDVGPTHSYRVLKSCKMGFK